MLFILLVLSKLKNVESHEISRRDRWSISTVLPILIKGRDKDSRDEAALEDLYILSVTDEEYPDTVYGQESFTLFPSLSEPFATKATPTEPSIIIISPRKTPPHHCDRQE